MKQKETMRKRAVLVFGAAAYALLFALCSQIDAAGTVDGLTAVLRFALAFLPAFAVLYMLMERVLPRCMCSAPKALERGGGGTLFGGRVYRAGDLLRRDVFDPLPGIIYVRYAVAGVPDRAQ